MMEVRSGKRSSNSRTYLSSEPRPLSRLSSHSPTSESGGNSERRTSFTSFGVGWGAGALACQALSNLTAFLAGLAAAATSDTRELALPKMDMMAGLLAFVCTGITCGAGGISGGSSSCCSSSTCTSTSSSRTSPRSSSHPSSPSQSPSCSCHPSSPSTSSHPCFPSSPSASSCPSSLRGQVSSSASSSSPSSAPTTLKCSSSFCS
mmetsp:Transcript_69594/g.151947  ORF Transcript_69594/g.151947 Transcript_69594/m.151947 type:complete len:205 (-) Transcript_69594:301-915(-)